MLQQLLAILGELGVVEGLILPIDVNESLEEQVVPQLLAELPLTPNRGQRRQEAALQRLHPADGWRAGISSSGSIHPSVVT